MTMTKNEYLRKAQKAYDNESISEEVYDTMVENVDIFCDEDDENYDSFLPRTYAEIEYDDLDTAEAAIGCRFDDMNYLRYRER